MADTILLADGFEHYDVTDMTANGWTPTDTSFAYTSGSNFPDIVPGRNTGKAFRFCMTYNVSGNTQGVLATKTFTPTAQGCVHLAFHPNQSGGSMGAGSNNNTPIFHLGNGTTRLISLAMNAQTGALGVYTGGSSVYKQADFTGATLLTNALNGLTSATTGLNTGDYNALRLVFSIADSGGIIELYLGTNKIFSFTGDTKPGTLTAVDTIVLWSGAQDSYGGTAYNGAGVIRAFDDLIITNTAADIGDCTIISLAPNAAGTNSAWTGSTDFALGAVSVFSPTYGAISSPTGTPAALYDGLRQQNNSTWQSSQTTGTAGSAWVKIDYGAAGARTLGAWRYVQNGAPISAPFVMTVLLQGSSDDTTWTTVDSVPGFSGGAYRDSGIRRLAAATTYRYWRLNSTGYSGSGGGISWAVTEFELFDAIAAPTPTQHLAELPPDTSSYVAGNASGDKLTLNWTDLASTAGTVKAVQLRLTAGTDSGSSTIAGVARVAGTDYDQSTTVGVSGSGTPVVIRWEENPLGGSWTRSYVNSAEFGVKRP